MYLHLNFVTRVKNWYIARHIDYEYIDACSNTYQVQEIE